MTGSTASRTLLPRRTWRSARPPGTRPSAVMSAVAASAGVTRTTHALGPSVEEELQRSGSSRRSSDRDRPKLRSKSAIPTIWTAPSVVPSREVVDERADRRRDRCDRAHRARNLGDVHARIRDLHSTTILGGTWYCPLRPIRSPSPPPATASTECVCVAQITDRDRRRVARRRFLRAIPAANCGRGQAPSS